MTPAPSETTQRPRRAVVIEIPMSPPLALSPNARRRGNVWEQRTATEELRKAAWAHALNDHAILVGLIASPVDVHEHIVWPKGQRLFDPDGLSSMCKAALDGIVDAGLIAGDSAKHVNKVSASQEKGSELQGKTIITITEVKH